MSRSTSFPAATATGVAAALLAFGALPGAAGADRPGEPAAATTGPARPVLVELFTSEGCSSCPSADALLARLQREQPVPGARIVLLALHVTYWDQLGWKDRFSSAAATARQEGYAGRLGRGSIYTPQAVVDGSAEAVGSDRPALLRLVAEAARRPKGTVSLRPAGDGQVELEASWDPAVAAEVFVAAVLPAAETEVAAGENAGRRLVHASVVARQVKAGEGRGGLRARLPRPTSKLGPVVLVAFVQERGGGRVLAVGEEVQPPAGGG